MRKPWHVQLSTLMIGLDSPGCEVVSRMPPGFEQTNGVRYHPDAGDKLPRSWPEKLRCRPTPCESK